MKQPFKEGDRVECIDATAIELIKGRVYQVKSITFSGAEWMTRLEGLPLGWYARRFRLAIIQNLDQPKPDLSDQLDALKYVMAKNQLVPECKCAFRAPAFGHDVGCTWTKKENE